MRTQRWILLPLLMACNAASVFGAESHNHSQGDHVTGGLKLDHGKKWPTDLSLRKGMTEIRVALEAKKGAIHLSKLPAGGYVQLGEKVSRTLSLIFKNCKLKPEADAMLHILLARILNGAAKMKNETNSAEQAKGASAVEAALSEYPKFFDHPGWRPMKGE